MKIIHNLSKEKVQILFNSPDDVISCKCEDFLTGIFAFYDKAGTRLFLCHPSRVEYFIPAGGLHD